MPVTAPLHPIQAFLKATASAARRAPAWFAAFEDTHMPAAMPEQLETLAATSPVAYLAAWLNGLAAAKRLGAQ